MSTNFQPFLDFHRWVKNSREVGSDALGHDAHYIPFDALEQYWEDSRISSILNSCSHDTPISVSIDDIIERYLRIFSTLVYISTSHSPKLHYIKWFMEEDTDDGVLPFKGQQHAFPNAVDGIQTFQQFQKEQWLFSPAAFGRKRFYMKELMPQTVLPFTVEKVLSGREGDSTIVKKCKVHRSCGLPVDSIVLKEFDSSEIEVSFKNEVDSYITLANKIRPEIYAEHFLKCYGSFKKGDKAFIMLEYTDQGSLWDFFKRNELPLEKHELYYLWTSLSNLFIGLDYIHSLEQVSINSNSEVRCVHQDLKPANIFVFKQGDENSYRYRFKIGDFGMSSIALVRSRSKSIKSRDNASTKMYGAPELTHHYSDLDDVDYGVLWDTDIWSMGCVLFEVLIWTICGSRGLSEFFRMRQRDTENVPRHTPQGYSGCFHDGKKRIHAVDEMKDLAMQRKRVFDDLSDSIGNIILKEMLRPSDKSRLEARALLHRFGDILVAEEGLPIHPGTVNRQSMAITALGEGRSPGGMGGMGVELRGFDGFQEHEQARSHATGQGMQDYGHQRSESMELRAKGSLVRSRNSRHGAAESHSTIEARPKHAESVSATSFRPESVLSRRSAPVQCDPNLISQSPASMERVSSSSNPAVEDLEQNTAHSSLYDYQTRGGTALANDQSRVVRPSYGSLSTVSGSRVKGPEPYATVTIAEVREWIDRSKKDRTIKPLRDQERALREIKDREQIFVVDDSDTMRDQHWDRVIELVKTLGYLVKSADPDGVVELFFTSRPTEPRKSGGKEISSLVRWLKEHPQTSRAGVCNMENRLGPILEHVKSGLKSSKRPKLFQRSRRGTNVYILTDAIWEGGTEVKCGVEEPIKSLRKAMLELGKTRATVALQFIQLGDDTLGEERLAYLDDTLGTELNFDIVDHRHHQRDGVWHMLVGSISRDLDKDNNAGNRAVIT